MVFERAVHDRDLTGLADLSGLLMSGWDYVQIIESEPRLEAFDRDLGNLLEALDADTAVALIAGLQTADGSGAFILAAPGLPLAGAVAGASAADLPPTLLALAGRTIPAAMPGRSLLASGTMSAGDYSAEEEALLRERLSGLGYIS
jgi:hypothetical protein